MRHADRWIESKYVQRRGRWLASRDSAEVGVGSRLITDRIAALYDQYLSRYARGRLIDLGCGKVPLYGCYRSLVDEVTCVDWPQSVHAGSHLDLEADLAQPLPCAAASFDTIILSDVLEHVPTPEALWSEMARLLAPGGHLLLNTPFLYGVHEAPHDYARYTEYALRRFALQVGLEVPLLLPIGGTLHVLADLLAKHLAHLPVLGNPLASAVQGVVELLDRSRFGQRVSARTGPRFPLGYFMVAQRPISAGAALAADR
jgi:SAM-dependent methyltransferase